MLNDFGTKNTAGNGNGKEMISNFGDEIFLSRLVKVIGKPYESRGWKIPWGRQVGLADSTTSRIFAGTVPTGEILSAISVYENCDLTWLLTGRQQPFLTHTAPTDIELSHLIASFLNPEPADWTVYWLTDDMRHAVVLEQPDRYRVGNGPSVDYRKIEVFVGALGVASGQVVDALPVAARWFVRVSAEVINALASGKAGTRFLFEEPGVLRQAEQRHLLTPSLGEQPAPYAGLPPDEIKLLEKYRRFSVADRRRFQNIGDALIRADQEERAML